MESETNEHCPNLPCLLTPGKTRRLTSASSPFTSSPIESFRMWRMPWRSMLERSDLGKLVLADSGGASTMHLRLEPVNSYVCLTTHFLDHHSKTPMIRTRCFRRALFQPVMAMGLRVQSRDGPINTALLTRLRVSGGIQPPSLSRPPGPAKLR